jgi:hypothetical protein
MVEADMTLEDIAAKTGLAPATVKVYASRTRATGLHHRPHCGVRIAPIYLDPLVHAKLSEVAQERDLDMRMVCEMLLSVIADDDLFSAILDG